MRIWRPARTSSRARSFIFARASDPALRSMGTQRAFARYHPKSGIHMSSRFRMKVGSSNIDTRATVSQADWCFAATRSPPGGMRSRPRYSDLVPAITRKSQRVERAHTFGPCMKILRGAANSGSSSTIHRRVLRKKAMLNRMERTRSMAGPDETGEAPAPTPLAWERLGDHCGILGADDAIAGERVDEGLRRLAAAHEDGHLRALRVRFEPGPKPDEEKLHVLESEHAGRCRAVPPGVRIDHGRHTRIGHLAKVGQRVVQFHH